MIYVASDLHYDTQYPNLRGNASVRSLAASLCTIGTPQDLLCLAGDLGTDKVSLGTCLDFFAGFPGKKCAVAGNHDVWVDPAKQDSWQRFQDLSDIFREHGFHALEDEPLVWNGWGIAGTMGWYDYSFADDINVPPGAYRDKMLPGAGTAMWSDALYVHWHLDDPQVTKLLANKLDLHLAALAREKQVLVVTHHLPTKKLLFHPRWAVSRQWRFLNAFLGSERFAEVISGHPNVSHVFSGHVHMSRETQLNGISYATVGGDYQTKELIAFDGSKLKRVKF